MRYNMSEFIFIALVIDLIGDDNNIVLPKDIAIV